MFLIQSGLGNEISVIRKSNLYKILRDYKDSDTIIFIGGGWLKADGSIKSNIDLYYKLLNVKLAQKFTKNVIIMPVSYGPFQYRFQEMLCARALNNSRLVSSRENYSYKIFKEKLDIKIVKSKDLLLIGKQKINKTNVKSGKRNTSSVKLALSLMNWDNADVCRKIAYVLNGISKDYELIVTPVFLDFNKASIEKNNLRKIKNNINRESENKIRFINGRLDVIDAIRNADIVISSRTNTTLLSIVYAKPFIAFSKHKKVNDILEDLKLGRYFIRERNLKYNSLIDKIDYVINNIDKIHYEISKRHSKVARTERKKWKEIFSKLN